ncbi:MAG: adenosylcobinamide-GDP ribazoletransferase [Lachnospiraceae bacterium]|nr:adenosylcobinamide-GDP ribazoletransferase [Lachnospiraceae bacterium]
MLKSFFVAFSMYSQIPVPRFTWNRDNMKYAISFFPLVGVVIGALNFLLYYLFAVRGEYISASFFKGADLSLTTTCLGTAIPLIITGGIHLDGYMDTTDALSSYGTKEKKLEILKDSHVGAFAVIGTILYYLIYVGTYSLVIRSKEAMAVVSLGFWFSRVLSAHGAVAFKYAKTSGMLYNFTSNMDKLPVQILIYVQLALSAVLMILASPAAGTAAILLNAAHLLLYQQRIYREFGGISGDTAGYFLTISELLNIIGACIFCLV